MSEITAIGLGLMGAALARAIQGAGHGLTVWNRSPARTEPFIAAGIPVAPDPVAAVAASPVVLVCIDDYGATRELLETASIAPLLTGRTIVQLSTGTPAEARAAAERMAALGAHYLDGAILAGPQHIGTDEAQILLSGDVEAHARAGPLLTCLGGTVRYLGENVAAASALDLAWLTTCYGRFLGLIHAANICNAEGASLEHFISLFPEKPDYQHYARVIHERSFDGATGTLAVWGNALKRIQRQGRDAGINTEIPDFASVFFERAIAAGHGGKNVMSLYKVLERA